MEQNRLREFFRRARIALSLIIGFVTGKLLAQSMAHHASEYFIGGFMLGMIATQLLYLAIDRLSGGE